MTEVAFAALLSAICWVESAHTPNAIHADDGGSASLGECQVKYATARELGYRGPISKLWLDRTTNRKYAGLYLRKQLKRYRGDVVKAVAAYNAGSVPKDGRPRNTKYVRKVLRALAEGR